MSKRVTAEVVLFLRGLVLCKGIGHSMAGRGPGSSYFTSCSNFGVAVLLKIMVAEDAFSKIL